MNQPTLGYLKKFFGLPLPIFIVLLFVAGCGGGGNGGGGGEAEPASLMVLNNNLAQKHGNQATDLMAEIVRIAKGSVLLQGRLRPGAYPSGGFTSQPIERSTKVLQAVTPGCPTITLPDVLGPEGFAMLIDYGSSPGCIDEFDGLTRSGRITINASNLTFDPVGDIQTASLDVSFTNFSIAENSVQGSTSIQVTSLTSETWNVNLTVSTPTESQTLTSQVTVTSVENSDIETLNGSGTFVSSLDGSFNFTLDGLEYDVDVPTVGFTPFVCDDPIGGTLTLTGTNSATITFGVPDPGCGFALLSLDGGENTRIALDRGTVPPATGPVIDTLVTGIQFLPGSFVSSNQLRTSLLVKAGNLYFTDSSDTPLKKISVNGGALTSLARKMGVPENLVVQGQNIFWIGGTNLNKTSLDGTMTTVLAKGERDPVSGGTVDIVADGTDVYWVNTVSSSSCSPSCTWIIQKVSMDSGISTTLVSVSQQIVALAADSTHIYWEERGSGPVTLGCGCGSAIKKVPKSGGETITLVDSWLNGILPPPSSGQVSGSWFPIGGITISGSELFFGDAGFGFYRVSRVSTSGGGIAVLANVPTTQNSIRKITADGTAVYWIDVGTRSLRKISITGGAISTLASDLNSQTDVVIGAEDAFWSESGTVGGCCVQVGTGRIRKVPLTGGVATTVIDGLDSPSALASDLSNIYMPLNKTQRLEYNSINSIC